MPSISDIPAEVISMIESGDYEFHSSLDIVLQTGPPIHIATEIITGVLTDDFGTVNYVDQLRESATLNESITLSVNRIELRAQNVDGILGRAISNTKNLEGAEGILSYIFINDDDESFQVSFLYGEISNSKRKGPDIGFQLVSHLCSDGQVGGYRTLQNSCFNRYKDIWCNSASPLSQGCSKLLSGPTGNNGCLDHLKAPGVTDPDDKGNISRARGFLFQIKPLPGTPPVGPTGIIDGGDDFTTYFKTRESLGGYTGRHSIPKYFIM